jgi:hypothetical protein
MYGIMNNKFCTGIYLETEDSGLGTSHVQVHHIFG